MAVVRSNRPIHEVLREASGIFRALSTECLGLVCQRVREQRFKPGEDILDNSSGEDRCLCIVANGSAELENEHVQRTLESGMAIGEASLLGLADLAGDRGLLRASTACVVQVLHQDDFADALAEFPDEEQAFNRLVQDFSTIGSPGGREGKKLWKTLQRSAVYRGSGMNFLSMLCRHMEAAVFAPGDALFERGEECLSEESPSFLVLAGQVQVEGEAEALVWTAGAGEVLGAAGPIGSAERRGTTARAWRKGLVYCARLPGLALELAFREHPEELGPLEQIVGRLEAAEEEAIHSRQEWLRQVAVPALARTPLLTGCPDEFLWAVAASLAEGSYIRGQDVTEVGLPSESMLVVLEGAVDLLSRAGAHVGGLGCDGVLGEAELLGLVGTRMISAKAASACRVLEVTSDALQRALEGPHGAAMKQGLEGLVQSRREQAERAVPLAALSIGAKEDPSVRTACLLAERLHFEAGQFWEPIPDSDPCGPHVGILAQGKAVLTIAPDDQEVMPVQPGSLVIEGQLADFGARVRVLSGDCEIYRLRRIELEAAARLGCLRGKARSVTQEVADWFYQFRLVEKEVRARFHERLNSAKGLLAIREPHPCDSCIQDWSRRRQKSLRRAEQMRMERAETVVGAGKPPLLQLPLLPKANMNSTEYRSWNLTSERKPFASKRGSSGSCKALPCLPKSLACYPVMRLPKVHSEPHLRRPGSRERSGSRERATFRD
mmetsp:Transcript_40968/g.118375  ORF Transcript_40968/g.118375 Transcript_40968/m.118375 type:complete len:721 (-) Transcript_40968:124-2286(-)